MLLTSPCRSLKSPLVCMFYTLEMKSLTYTLAQRLSSTARPGSGPITTDRHPLAYMTVLGLVQGGEHNDLWGTHIHHSVPVSPSPQYPTSMTWVQGLAPRPIPAPCWCTSWEITVTLQHCDPATYVGDHRELRAAACLLAWPLLLQTTENEPVDEELFLPAVSLPFKQMCRP